MARTDRQPIRLAALLALALALLAGTAPPARASATDVIRDCSEDGALDGRYSHSEIERALEQLPSDLDEYTDCRSVIRGAQLGSAGGRDGGRRNRGVASRIDTTSPPSVGEVERIGAAAGSEGPVKVGDRVVRPGASARPFNASGLGGELPPLFVALLLAAACAALCGGVFALRRSPRASAPLARMGEGVRRGISRFRR